MSDILTCTFCCFDSAIAKKINKAANIAMFIAMTVFEYALPMFFKNFDVPTCNAHMPNINANMNVNSAEFKPINRILANVININVAIVFVFDDKIQSCTRLCHLHLICRDVFFALSSLNIYPGAHNADRPNGILNIIFHPGIPSSRARRYFAYTPQSNNPIRYRQKMEASKPTRIVLIDVWASIITR